MKREFMIVVGDIFLILSLVFLIYNFNPVLTGFAVSDVNYSGVEYDENSSVITQEDALQGISEAEAILEEMKNNNFSGIYVEDLLIRARNVFQQVKYAEILRKDVEATQVERVEAVEALKLVDWKDINYSLVLIQTENIKEVRELAFFVTDLLSIQESFLGAERDESGKIVSFSKVEEVNLEKFRNLINEIEDALNESRFEEAESLTIALKEEVELRRNEALTSLALKASAEQFLKKYWYLVVLILILIFVVGRFFYKKFEKKLLKKKIEKMNLEKKVLIDLMKRTQVERFRENKISGLVYNLRMKKYKEKLQKVKQELPFLEKKLVKIKKVGYGVKGEGSEKMVVKS
ncbi:hypothetical protein HOE04_03105 [archaeon]|nr:hypothetical protein [archaeon]